MGEVVDAGGGGGKQTVAYRMKKHPPHISATVISFPFLPMQARDERGMTSCGGMAEGFFDRWTVLYLSGLLRASGERA